jgi:hypothetical protein
VRILSNDTGFGFEFGSNHVAEDAGTVVLGVRRGSDDASQPFTVDFETRERTAKAGLDSVSTQGRLSFAVGERVRTLTVPLLEDDLREMDEHLGR